MIHNLQISRRSDQEFPICLFSHLVHGRRISANVHKCDDGLSKGSMGGMWRESTLHVLAVTWLFGHILSTGSLGLIFTLSHNQKLLNLFISPARRDVVNITFCSLLDICVLPLVHRCTPCPARCSVHTLYTLFWRLYSHRRLIQSWD